MKTPKRQVLHRIFEDGEKVIVVDNTNHEDDLKLGEEYTIKCDLEMGWVELKGKKMKADPTCPFPVELFRSKNALLH